RVIRAAEAAGANLLIVHHGLFWGGLQPLTGHRYDRVRLLLEADIALYSAHLPLDAHATLGNSRLLAGHLGLTVADGFAPQGGIPGGVGGEADVPTAALLASLNAFSRMHGGTAFGSAFDGDRRSHRWAICSGAGAGVSTLDEATALGIDTLV